MAPNNEEHWHSKRFLTQDAVSAEKTGFEREEFPLYWILLPCGASDILRINLFLQRAVDRASPFGYFWSSQIHLNHNTHQKYPMKTTHPHHRLRTLLPAALLIAASSLSFGQSTWNGTTSLWNTAGNWSPSGVPGSGASVIVDTVTGGVLALDASPTLTNWSSNSTTSGITATSSGASRTLDISGTLTKTGGQGFVFRSNGAAKLSMNIGTIDMTAVGAPLIFGQSGNELTSLNITTANVSATSGGGIFYSVKLLKLCRAG